MTSNAGAKTTGGREIRWSLRLYVAGVSRKSVTAMENLKKLRAEGLPARCEVEVIDLLRSPFLARRDQILAIPTLVRTAPGPIRRLVGDLSNTERVLKALGLPA